MNKKNAIAILSHLYNDAEKLLNEEYPRSLRLVKWKTQTLSALLRLYGEQSKPVENFSSLPFINMRNESDGSIISYIRDDLEEAAGIIQGCIEDIRAFNLPASRNKSKTDRLLEFVPFAKFTLQEVVKNIILLLFTPLILFLNSHFGKPDSSPATIIYENPQKYKQIRVDFTNWLEQYDKTSIDGLKKLRYDVRKRVGTESGIEITDCIEYLRNCRMIRDNKIDSFLVAYSIAGGDTLELKYSRKLPPELKRGFPSIQKSINRITWKSLGLDTL